MRGDKQVFTLLRPYDIRQSGGAQVREDLLLRSSQACGYRLPRIQMTRKSWLILCVKIEQQLQ